MISIWDVTGGSEEILVTTDANGTWEITPDDVEDTPYDGTYALSLTAKDSSGTVLGTQTSEVTFASGNLAPTETVTINLNDNDGTLTAAELETWVGITGTAPAGSELTLISIWDVTGGSEEILVTTDANGTWEITPDDVEDTPYDGTYALSLTAKDSSGTVLGTQTSEVTFASGNLAPTETVTINLNDNDGTLTAAELETWVGITGTAPAGSELTLISIWDVTGGSEEILVTTDANGTWEITPDDVEDTPYDGTYALSLTAKDSSGTVLGTQTSEVTFASGNLAPTETVTINLNDNDGTLTAAELETWVGLTGTAPAGSELTLISTWDVTGGSEEILVTTDANGTWEITPEDVEDTPYDGTYALSLTARDASGTVLGTQTSEVTFASGNLAPTETVTINLNDNDGTLTAAELETWVGLTGTAPAGSELTLISTWDVTGGSEEILVTTDANGTWEITPEDVEDTPYDGTYALSLTARDASGTVLGTQTSEVTFASGNLAPTETVTINLNDNDGTLTAAELETWVGLTGTAPAGSELTLISTWDVTGGSEEILVTTDANGTWEITPEDVEDTPYDGTYALSLTARDASGTVLGTQTSEVTFASGNLAPTETVTINLNDNDGTLTAAELETWVGLTGTAPAGSELTLISTWDVTGGSEEILVTTDANGTWEITPEDVEDTPYDGTYALSLTARDASGTVLGTQTSEVTFASGNLAPTETVTINLNDNDGTLTAAELETWVGLTGTAPAGSELTLISTWDVTGGSEEILVTTDANGTWEITPEDVEDTPYDGTYALSLTARDASGTVLGTQTSEVTFASGNLAPTETVTINLNDNDGTLTAAELETWVGITGTAPAGSELTLISIWDVTGGSEEILVTTDANGTWEITPDDVEDTPYDGTYALSLTAKDSSGTVLGTQTSEVTFASGNLAPTETVTINLNDNDGTLTAAELETWVGITGTAPAGSELTLISIWDVTGGSEEILVTTDANGTWEITPDDVEDTPYDGTYALSLTAKDSSGTVLGTQTSEVTFASGNLAPIMGDDGDNILTGTDGNDTLDGGSGNDTLSGGAGDDVYEYWGYEGFDVISETSGFDTIVFKEAHNENAGWGSPFQEGDDLVYVADNGISGFRVTDHFSDPDKSIELFEYELSGYSVLVRNSDQEIVDPFGNYDELLVGTVGNDTIIGAAGDNIIHDEIYGYGGDDTIDNSVGGKSWIEAGDGDDVVTGGASEDRIRGQGGDDKLSGNDGNDYLFGGAGDDTLDGGAGDDMVLGGAGDDTIIAVGGSDTFDGGEGSDTLLEDNTGLEEFSVDLYFDLSTGKHGVVGKETGIDEVISVENYTIEEAFNVTLTGDENANRFTANAGDDVLYGFGGNDTLDGGAGDDAITGGAGDDVLIGGSGNDTLTGGAGDDIIYGGAGDDTYVFEFQGNDTVIDSSGNNIVFADTKGDNGELRFRQLYQSNDQLVLEGSRENTDSKISMSGVESIKWGVIDDGYTMTLGVSGETSDVSNSMYVGTLSDDTLITGQGDYVEGYGADGDDTITVLGGSSWVLGRWGKTRLLVVKAMIL